MKLTKEQVEYIAKLARIKLTSKEVAKFQDQLSQILNYIEQLGEVDTTDVEPTAQVTGLENVTREDKVEQCDPEVVEKLIEAFPE
ncbi:MAG TPA: Asp-tRNA(Asn)/Glu-tRNA(Gln) amidotransferase subunit GatC, partial [Patescibacteria group bacterium]